MIVSRILLATLGAAFAAAIPTSLFRRDQDCTPLTRERVQLELGSQLSSQANLYFPGSAAFDQAKHRWSTYEAPNISVVVEVATPEDVAATIQYANSVGKPFLARSGGHGSASTLANVQDGFQIWLNQFKGIELAEDGQTATIGSGLVVQEIMDGLDAYGKVTSTGACGCVGLGAGLGGGHGRMQGFFGLIADNILSANVVLWNGTQITTNSTSHPDLFWALRGAGHNFGIVTSATLRVYEPPASTWYVATLTYDLTSHSSLYSILTSQAAAGVPPSMAMRYILYTWSPIYNRQTVTLSFNFAGPPSSAAPFISPFLALSPLNTTIHEAVPYTSVPTLSGTGPDSEVCTLAAAHLQFAAYTPVINETALFESASLLNNIFNTYPSSREGTTMLFEAYATSGVRAFPDDFNAFSHRNSDYLFDANIIFPEGEEIPEGVLERGEEIRDAVRRGAGEDAPLEVYVNYALGTESLESLYGGEERLERLREVKGRYDPEGRFGYFMPIV